MGMQHHDSVLDELQADEVAVLLRLYYQQGEIEGVFSPGDKNISSLADKHLISTLIDHDTSLVSLTAAGLDICSSMMKEQVQDKAEMFREQVQVLPARAVTCLVNRVIWHPCVDIPMCSSSPGFRPVNEHAIWYERVLLTSDEIKQALGGLYVLLESLEFASKVDGQWWCPPEVETFLQQEYKEQLGLSWGEEDMLKYYYFFSAYAFHQKNMLNMSTLAPRYKALLSGEPLSAMSWSGITSLGPQSLVEQLELNHKRVNSLLKRLDRLGLVQERYYPMSAFSLNDEEDNVFFIKDIHGYMKFIDAQFLQPVVSALLG
jgi:hypothetical protein